MNNAKYGINMYNPPLDLDAFNNMVTLGWMIIAAIGGIAAGFLSIKLNNTIQYEKENETKRDE